MRNITTEVATVPAAGTIASYALRTPWWELLAMRLAIADVLDRRH